MFYKKTIANWGNYPVMKCNFFEPKFIEDLKKILMSDASAIARGNGRCYGDSALSKNIISTRALNKILALDELSGIITCQAGILLSEILEVIVPKGFFLPVTPGTKFITVGGAIASDIHGKNHHSEGCFSQHVLAMKVALANGQIIECDKENNYDLFAATSGGMGLTGIIIEVTFKLKKITSSFIKQESIKAKNIHEIMDLFEQSEAWTYTVAWIDCLAKGDDIGRSILMRGEHATKEEIDRKVKTKDPLSIPQKLKLNIPFNFPDIALNTFSVKAFNFLFYHKQFQKEIKNFVAYDTFFYPLDAINNWNRMYGKKGFTQYQFVLPKESSKEGLIKILKKISESGQGSFLAVLKLFGKPNSESILSFPKEGYTLALDFKINNSLFKLLDELDKIVLDHGGRLYLTKDVRMTEEFFEKTYQEKPSFISMLKRFNPSKKFSSIQSERVGL